MSDRDAVGWLDERLSNARTDAARITRELAHKGYLTAEQVDAVAAAVESAIDQGRELIADALREPRRVLDGLRSGSAGNRGHADSTDVATGHEVGARIQALETRIAALEEALLRGTHRTRRGSEGD